MLALWSPPYFRKLLLVSVYVLWGNSSPKFGCVPNFSGSLYLIVIVNINHFPAQLSISILYSFETLLTQVPASTIFLIIKINVPSFELFDQIKCVSKHQDLHMFGPKLNKI